MGYKLSYDFSCSRERERLPNMMARKTTDEIRGLLTNAKLDFNEIENEALNAYLPKIFHICPFSEDICTAKQCMNCEVFKNSAKKTKLEVKIKNVSTRERI
jgi:hypothetical protein